MSRKVLILVCLIVAALAYVARKDNAPLRVEIDKLGHDRTVLADELRRYRGKKVPAATDYDDVRFKLRALGQQPAYQSSAFVYPVTAVSPDALAGKIAHIKMLLPYTYIERVALNGATIKVTLVTQEKGS